MSSNSKSVKSKSCSNSGSSKSKTMKKRSPKKIPTFQDIYDQKEVFPEKIKMVIELINKQTIEDDDDNIIKDKRVLFYTEYTKGWEYLEEPMDHNNLLDIHKPLTKAYFRRIENKNKKFMTHLTDIYDYHTKEKHKDYFKYSYSRFRILKQLPSLLVKYTNAVILSKNHLSRNTRLPPEIANIISNDLLNDPEYVKMMKRGS